MKNKVIRIVFIIISFGLFITAIILTNNSFHEKIDTVKLLPIVAAKKVMIGMGFVILLVIFIALTFVLPKKDFKFNNDIETYKIFSLNEIWKSWTTAQKMVLLLMIIINIYILGEVNLFSKFVYFMMYMCMNYIVYILFLKKESKN